MWGIGHAIRGCGASPHLLDSFASFDSFALFAWFDLGSAESGVAQRSGVGLATSGPTAGAGAPSRCQPRLGRARVFAATVRRIEPRSMSHGS